MEDVIIIGAGPAGLMCAIESSKKHNVLVLEKNDSAGKKLLITGNGRCNLTNLKDNNLFLENIEYNKKYLYSAINTFGPTDVYNFFNKTVKLKEERDNQIFPVSNKSIDILNCLIDNLKNTKINYNEAVIDIVIHDDYKEIITIKKTYKTKNVVIATGGSSFKNTGSSGDHIIFAKRMKQPIIELFPAEVSIYLLEKNDLAGTSFDNVNIHLKKRTTTGNLIFTHKGLSGSSVFNMSEHIYHDVEKIISIDFLPHMTDTDLNNLFNEMSEKQPITLLTNFFSKRFSNYLIKKWNVDEQLKFKNLSEKNKLSLISLIKKHIYKIEKTEDINQAYVTGGGIDLKYINTSTFESKINKKVYFIGESLDIHGKVGGYNLTLAFSTGYKAGISIE